MTWNYLNDDGDGVLNYADSCPQKYAETNNDCPQNDGSGSNSGDDDENDWGQD